MLNFNFEVKYFQLTNFHESWRDDRGRTVITQLGIAHVYTSKMIPLTVLFSSNVDNCTITIHEVRAMFHLNSSLIDLSNIFTEDQMGYIKNLLSEYIRDKYFYKVVL